MGEAKEQIVDEMAQARGALDNDLRALEARIKKETDTPVQAQRHLWALAAMETASGLFLGMIFGRVSAE